MKSPLPADPAIDRHGLHFSGGSPSLHLLLGPDETPWDWRGVPPEPTIQRRRQTPLGEGTESLARWDVSDGLRLEWRITKLARFPGFSLRTIFTNLADRPVRLRRLGIIESLALRVDPEEWFVSNATGGWEVPHAGLLSKTSPAGRRFRDFAAIYSQRGERGVYLAAVGPGGSDVGIEICKGPDGFDFSIASEMSDILVDAGESRTSEECLFLFAPYREASESAMRWIAATHGSRVHRGAFTGWCSWYEQHTNVTADHVIDVAQAIESRRSVIPHAVIQIDEGYEKAWGDWDLNSKFPEGWAPVTRAIRDAGATPGVWIAPLGVYDSLNLHLEHPEWFQFAASSCQPVGTNFHGNPLHFLDPTHPEVRQFIRKILRAAMAEGFRYFKIDFNLIEAGRFFDQKLTRFQAHRSLYRLYREEVGEKSYLNSCCFRLDRAVVGLVDAMRIGADSDYQWPWIQSAIRAVAETCPANGILMAADPDVFYTMPRSGASSPVTNEQLRSWQGFVGLLGGLVMTSEPLQKSGYQSSIRELEILTPPVTERGRTFLPGTEWYPSLFGFIAERLWGDFAVVQMFNASDAAGDVRLCAPDLDRLGDCHLWSFRDGEYLGVGSSGHIEKSLPPWGSRLIRMSPVTDKPTLVGSDLHMGMGSAEIASFSVAETTISIEFSDAGARAGTLWIHSGASLEIESFEGCTAALEGGDKDLWMLRLSGRQRASRQKIVLALGRPARASRSVEGVDFADLSKARLKIESVEPPCVGEETIPGELRLSISHAAEREMSGEICLLSDAGQAVRFVPARIPFRLAPGEEMSRSVSVVPNAFKPAAIVAASIRNSIRAWAPLTMRRAPVRIPFGDEPIERLPLLARKMSPMPLPNDPPAARVRMAASRENLFFEIQVDDSQPWAHPDLFWEGSCVEFFFANSGSPAIRQFFIQPDLAGRSPAVQEVKGTGCREVCTRITASTEASETGYQLITCLPRSAVGISPDEREWLLEIQVSRFANRRLEHHPLFGGPGAFASSALYARIVEGGQVSQR